MQNLFRFLQRYSNFLLFIVLEVVAFLLYALTQPYQHSRFFSAANHATASVTSVSDYIGSYFSLLRVNADLNRENAQLREYIATLQSIVEQQAEQDTTYHYAHLQWKYIPAKVVDMQTNTNHNYLVINKGSRDNIQAGQGVLCHGGVAGVVSKVNHHFSLVVPTIHPKMNLSCRLSRNRQQGFLHWDGPDCHHANLHDIGRHVDVHEGDSVVTSGLTGRFPENIMVGVVEKVSLSDGDACYHIRVRLSTDYKRLEYVQVINNPMEFEQRQMIESEP